MLVCIIIITGCSVGFVFVDSWYADMLFQPFWDSLFESRISYCEGSGRTWTGWLFGASNQPSQPRTSADGLSEIMGGNGVQQTQLDMYSDLEKERINVENDPTLSPRTKDRVSEFLKGKAEV